MKKFVIALLCVGLLFCNSTAAFAEDFYQGDYEDEFMKKVAVHTLNDINISGGNGPIELNIRSLEVQELTIKDGEVAELFEIEPDKPYTAVSLYVEVENTSDHDISFLPTASQIVTEQKEQVHCSSIASDSFSGTYYGSVKEDGALTFILPESDPYEINTLTFVFESPFDQTETHSFDVFKITVDMPDENEEADL